GLVHLENLAGLASRGEIDLAAIGDRFAPALATALDRARAWLTPEAANAVTACTAPEAMASSCRLDACVVASRTEDHARDTLAFAGRGIRVLVEKPLAQTVADAARLIAALEPAQAALVQVAFQRHYDAAMQAAQHWIAAGRIGAIQQSHHVLQDKNPTPASYQSAGLTADMAIHLVYEAMAFHGGAL